MASILCWKEAKCPVLTKVTQNREGGSEGISKMVWPKKTALSLWMKSQKFVIAL